MEEVGPITSSREPNILPNPNGALSLNALNELVFSNKLINCLISDETASSSSSSAEALEGTFLAGRPGWAVVEAAMNERGFATLTDTEDRVLAEEASAVIRSPYLRRKFAGRRPVAGFGWRRTPWQQRPRKRRVISDPFMLGIARFKWLGKTL